MPRLEVVLMDWGDTLMRNFPHFPGPMAHWPQVEAMPGAAEALASLRGRYRVVLATSARDSDAALVRAALARVDLAHLVDDIYTFREIGVRKPDPGFFHGILRAVGCPPQAAVMVGDDYWADAVGAKRAGLWAIWYNPRGEPAPRHLGPPPDQTISHLTDLPAALDLLR